MTLPRKVFLVACLTLLTGCGSTAAKAGSSPTPTDTSPPPVYATTAAPSAGSTALPGIVDVTCSQFNAVYKPGDPPNQPELGSGLTAVQWTRAVLGALLERDGGPATNGIYQLTFEIKIFTECVPSSAADSSVVDLAVGIYDQEPTAYHL